MMIERSGKHSPLLRRHAAIVAAAAARIFPTTDTPGATEAGVIDYVERLLAEAYPEQAGFYRNGCRAVDRHARRRFGSGFLRIPQSDQDAVLADFEAGQVPDFKRASEFFETLRSHTMEGVLGEPAYGGNRDMIGWKLVGFPGHQFGYADSYINQRVDMDPVALDRPFPKERNRHGKSR